MKLRLKNKSQKKLHKIFQLNKNKRTKQHIYIPIAGRISKVLKRIYTLVELNHYKLFRKK